MLKTYFSRLAGAFTLTAVTFATAEFLSHSLQSQGVATESSVTEASIYQSQVQPIFTARCVACHSCNTAPCQLNLTNYDGAIRGANKIPINQPFKQSPAHATRLGIDEQTEDGWRALGFFSVVKPMSDSASSLMNALGVKQSNPTGDPPTVKADYARSCPANSNEWALFKKTHGDQGMPYGLPPLTAGEFNVIADWLKNGAPGPNARERDRLTHPTNEAGIKVIARAESFLNESSLKSKIVSRYLYEHLFLAHIQFKNEMPGQFYRLTRSRTKCSLPIDEIATVRPYEDPGVREFSYCFRKLDQVVTEKNHIVYEMSDARLQHWQSLFFGKPWVATKLPSYNVESSANPFLTFRELPAESRYKWLLEDSQYTVMTFIKGSVCRGHTAVNVIDEQFQILFLDPKADHFVNDPAYADKVTPYLKLPGHYGSNVKFIKLSSNIVPILMSELKNKRNVYRGLRDQKYAVDRPQGYSINDIWDGDGLNPNAVLTVYRHFDSAQVLKGRWGPQPKTAWVLDYPLFEPIVYDLVAGYDVYGTMGHQLLTRVYMHFIRI